MDPIVEALTAATAENDRLAKQLASAKQAEQTALDRARAQNSELLRTRDHRTADLEATRQRLRPLEFKHDAALSVRMHVLRVGQEITRGVLGTAAFIGWLMAGTTDLATGWALVGLLAGEAACVWWLANFANREEQIQ